MLDPVDIGLAYKRRWGKRRKDREKATRSRKHLRQRTTMPPTTVSHRCTNPTGVARLHSIFSSVDFRVRPMSCR